MTLRYDHTLPMVPGIFAYTAAPIQVAGDQGEVAIQSLSLSLTAPRRVYLLSEFRITGASGSVLSAMLKLELNGANVGEIKLIDGQSPSDVPEVPWQSRIWGTSPGIGVQNYDLRLLVEGGSSSDTITIEHRRLEWVPAP